jgi:hypothetical protein
MITKRILNIAPFFKSWVNEYAQSLEEPNVVIGNDYDNPKNFTIFFNPEINTKRNKGNSDLADFNGKVTIYYTMPDMCECCDCWITQLENLNICKQYMQLGCCETYYIDKLVTTQATILTNKNIIAVSFDIQLRITQIKENKC